MATHTLFPGLLPEFRESDDPEQAIDEALDAGDCPWCDEYDGENPGAHAAQAHSEEWRAYRGELEEDDPADDEESSGEEGEGE